MTERTADDLDHVWSALANPIRRRMLDVLREGACSTGRLVEQVDADRDVVIQHLRVLRQADLVTVTKAGRRRINHLNVIPIQLIYERWVSAYEGHWASALTGLKSTLETRETKESDSA
ncbi:ArsR/SmtB family transcription factor [Euzebya tangerina]|uniref:ArsR/SmtB family transcription factor n=1 Tax=Euzebya tangerina TaxID=591198 RepID=UPI000E323DF9|nr:metalloregulator ArsR/SmtB family transcription factor [Euzebya tangerina]